MTSHTAYMWVSHDSEGHGECLDCDWVGPDRKGLNLIARDCREHEDECEAAEESRRSV